MSFSQISTLPRIKDVELGETIGHGAFACVKTAHLRADPSVVFAVKFVHIPTCKDNGLTEKDITKEVVLQSKCSQHPNILKVIDCNISTDFMWIVMEMADGGDLFDKIEPDVGVDSEVAQFYFQQLVRAILYLHEECGIAHRDIKPENVLLDKNGNLKLADFGLASQFRRKDGSLRISTDQRGSPPYMAPEILHSTEYLAYLTDIWSIGILIFVLLTGEIPWEFPVLEDEKFDYFIRNDGNINLGPWAKVDFTHLNLLRKILQPDPENRVSISSLIIHPWFTTQINFANSNGLCNNPALLAKKLLCNLKVSLSDDEYLKSTQEVFNPTTKQNMSISTQPMNSELAQIEPDYLNRDLYSVTQRAFTQYISNTDTVDTFLNQEPKWTQFISNDLAALQFCDINDSSPRKDIFFNPNKLTKFYSLEEMDIILPVLEKALKYSGIKVKPDLYDNFIKILNISKQNDIYPVLINIRTEDRNGSMLTGAVVICNREENLKSINFDRKSGDPLEWRRLFKKIALFCRAIILVPT